MQESAAAAVSFVRSRAEHLGSIPSSSRSIDLHLHVPKGGTPKDGPSAGVTMFTAVASLLLDCPVRKEVAHDRRDLAARRVLPVGGIKEKLLAAHRAGHQGGAHPDRNENDLEDVPAEVRADLDIQLIRRMDEVLSLVLEPPVKRTDGSIPPDSDQHEA